MGGLGERAKVVGCTACIIDKHASSHLCNKSIVSKMKAFNQSANIKNWVLHGQIAKVVQDFILI